jgi:hypothetical protein
MVGWLVGCACRLSTLVYVAVACLEQTSAKKTLLEGWKSSPLVAVVRPMEKFYDGPLPHFGGDQGGCGGKGHRQHGLT